MELQLKHIAAYLPYEISAECDNKDYSDGFVRGVLCNFLAKHQVFLCGEPRFLKDVRLILKPMSKLTRAELEKAGFRTHIDYLTYELQEHKAKGLDWIGRLQNAPYKMIEYLCSKHYDIFGLLDVGLAVE